MIKKYNLFLESIEQNINHLIEDAFVPMCDEHGLDFRTMEGYFVNTMGSNVPNHLPDEIKQTFWQIVFYLVES